MSELEISNTSYVRIPKGPQPDVVILERFKIDGWKTWLMFQLKTFNVSNLLFIVIIAVLVSTVNNTKQSLESENKTALDTLTRVHVELQNASDVVAAVRLLRSEIQDLQQQRATLNNTLLMLQEQVQGNFLQNRFVSTSAPSTTIGSSMTTVSWNPLPTNNFVSLSTDTLVFLKDGTYKITWTFYNTMDTVGAMIVGMSQHNNWVPGHNPFTETPTAFFLYFDVFTVAAGDSLTPTAQVLATGITSKANLVTLYVEMLSFPKA